MMMYSEFNEDRLKQNNLTKEQWFSGIDKVMNEVDVIKVDPKNTSKIGKEKYTKIKGLSVHYCAAYVINRKGMGFVD